MRHIKLLFAGFLLSTTFLAAQAQRTITPADLEKWQRITSRSISDDGKWVAATFSPWRGDSRVELYSADGKEKKCYSPTGEYRFSSSSQYFLVKEVPALQLTDSLKLKKAKNMPMDKLTIRSLKSGSEWQIDSLVGYRLSESHDIIAYQRVHKDSALIIATLDGKETTRFKKIKSYSFAKKSPTLYYTIKDTVEGRVPGLYIWHNGDTIPTLIKSGKENFVNISMNEDASKIAFLYSATPKVKNSLSLWLSENGVTAREIVTQKSNGVPAEWIISSNYTPWFSKDNNRIFLGTAPRPLEKDTTILESNRPNVQVWSWDEPVQYTVQKYNVNSELKRSYTAVYNITTNKLIQLSDTALPNIQLPTNGVGEWAILSTSRPYSLSSMWEGRSRSDYYKVSLATGARTPIVAADYTGYRLSSGGKYAIGYNPTDSCWYTVNLQTEKNQLVRLTTPDTFIAWDEDNDLPDYPGAHGCAGWTKDDARVLIYDRYDIWSFNPEGNEKPVNLTKNGRTNRIRYRRLHIEHDEKFIDAKKPSMLSGFNEKDKTTHYFQSKNLASAHAPKQLTEGVFRHGNLTKARKAEKFIYSRENTATFPDVCVADASLKKGRQLTQGIEQQKEFIWNNVELVSWESYDGVKLEGLLYKPANFDPNKKYPMIVNFYERSSDGMHNYRTPQPNRSTVDYCTYLSDGYIIFNPDVRYGGGYPGKSCYNCVMAGIDNLLTRGYIDSTRIGAQGHSWGGYQVAYLATRTDRFAAIESGAPVVNMFSAYGGIRWGSGRARAFQYEHTQSRLGGTPWSHPERYHESSPLFAMDKVKTPILIMHNDQDGHVPWYQGIEYFVALKRLGKPAWLLNYTGEPHWPLKYPNSMDFQIRMKQFFDHYLKGAPMPKWMSEGVPAVKQPYELGY